jgi:hypothetical protein
MLSQSIGNIQIDTDRLKGRLAGGIVQAKEIRGVGVPMKLAHRELVINLLQSGYF